jgi:hypothetical protein
MTGHKPLKTTKKQFLVGEYIQTGDSYLCTKSLLCDLKNLFLYHG